MRRASISSLVSFRFTYGVVTCASCSSVKTVLPTIFICCMNAVTEGYAPGVSAGGRGAGASSLGGGTGSLSGMGNLSWRDLPVGSPRGLWASAETHAKQKKSERKMRPFIAIPILS